MGTTQGYISEVWDFFEYTIVRLGSSYMVRLHNRIKTVIDDYLPLITPENFSSEVSRKLLNHNGPKWDKRHRKLLIPMVKNMHLLPPGLEDS